VLEPALTRLLAALSLLVPLAAAALEGEARFQALQEGAQRLEGGLGAFLERCVGECQGAPDGACAASAAAFRRQYQGKRLYLVVSEEGASMVAPGAVDTARGEATVRLTPFFPASGYALTHGSPRQTDAQGNPVLPLVHIPASLPEDWDARMFQRAFQLRGLKLQVVFVPQGVWSLPRRGGGRMHGVSARVEAVRVTVERTGEPLGVWLASAR
jgi:hypothetical protein